MESFKVRRELRDSAVRERLSAVAFREHNALVNAAIAYARAISPVIEGEPTNDNKYAKLYIASVGLTVLQSATNVAYDIMRDAAGDL